MKTKDFNFELPDELIAQYPMKNRSDSRLLVYKKDSQQYVHSNFYQLVDFLQPNDLLVVNDSRVIPARLYGKKTSGGKIEVLVERILSTEHMLVHIKASKTPRPGTKIQINSLENEVSPWIIEVIEKRNDLYYVAVNGLVEQMLDEVGHIPLPGYINRADEQHDITRYQTIYARHKGSVAAPTAGLHIDEKVMHDLSKHNIQLSYVTLHVGAGTFRPVRCENIQDHVMHSEYYTVSEELCELVRKTKQQGGRVIAVGTTALRCLESAAREGILKPGSGDTSIFITPGYKFNVCDGLITNFHLPESTLLMLVSAFIGYKEAMALYQEAIRERYRFYSYGDASLLL